MTEKRTLVLIDGHALAYRAYFALPATFSTGEGEPTNAIYGFTSMLLAVWNERQPDYFIVAFDRGDTFRHQKYPDYKATREKMPDDLHSQIERIEQLVRAFNMPIFAKEGYEADDLLGTLARQAAEQEIESLIVTGDRDTFQLVGPRIKVILPGKKSGEREEYDEERVKKRYDGLTPRQLIDLKGLMGDSSDNIPGIRGIGEKTGIKLLQQYGSLEAIYEHLDEQTKSIRQKLEEGREIAFLSRELGRIETEVPGVALDIQAGKTMDFDLTGVANLFVELEFGSIFNRIPGAPPDKSPEDIATIDPAPSTTTPDGDYTTIDSPTRLADLVAKLKQSQQLAVDVETDSVDEVQANLVGIAISPAAGEGYYIPVGHQDKILPPAGQQASLFDPPPAGEALSPGITQLELAAVRESLAPILADERITKYMHNAKFDITVLEQHGLPVQPPIFDTMIASWLGHNAEEARHGLKNLAQEKLNREMTEITELIGTGKKQITMDRIPIAEVTPYAAADVDMTLRLAPLVKEPLAGPLWQIFQQLELPLIYVLKDMELAGIKLDVAYLNQISEQLGQRLIELEQEIHRVAGESFNINSTQQLSDILFKKFKLPTSVSRKTKSGHYSTAAGVLERLQGQHEIIDLILEHRSLAKLKSTYVDALPELVNPRTGRIHTNYNQIGISTGRLSSSNPNLQNIPIRTQQGREIRRAFVAEPGHSLIAADYSQVELRILAHIAEDPGLLQAFANDEDIHAATAATVLGIPLEQITKEQRRIAKTVNFGLIYGQTAYGLAQSTGMSRTEADAFIQTYFEKYPKIQDYIERTKKMALEQGYVTTLLGRRREFPNLAELGGARRSAAEREAINAPIQGTAADIMKQAMIDLHRQLRERPYQSRLLLQVHDELVLEAPQAEVEEIAQLTRRVMSDAFDLRVPLKVDVEIGPNWLEMERLM